MPERPRKTRRRHGPLRRGFRYFRILLLLVLLLVVGVVTYLNRVGLPDFVKDSLLGEIQQLGYDARISRLSWRWHEGVVAEDISLEPRSTNGVGPEFSADRAAIRLDMSALGRLRWRFEEVELDNANLNWRLSDTHLSDQLRLSDIDTLVRFPTDGSLELVRLKSTFKGLDLSVTGTLLNPRDIVTRGDEAPRPPPDLQVLNEAMNRVANYLTNFQFAATPELRLRFSADAAHWGGLNADLMVRLPETTTSWGGVDEMDLLARVRPPPSENAEASMEVLLTGTRANTPWGQLWNWEVQTRTVPVLELPINSSNVVQLAFASLETEYGTVERGTLDFVVQPVSAERPDEMDMVVNLGGQRFVTEWGTAGQLELEYHGTISRSQWIPLKGTNQVTLSDIESPHGRAERVELRVGQEPRRADWQPAADASWGPWRHIEPYLLDFFIEGQGVDAQGVQVEYARLSGRWAAPVLELNDVESRLYGGDMRLSGSIDVPSGRIGFRAVTDWDFHQVDHKFSDKFRRWFAPYQWGSPPHVEASGQLVWPGWDFSKPKWKTDIGPSMSLSGTFQAENPSYRGIAGQTASSSFHLTNFVWWLPDLTVVRPEGTTVAEYRGSDLTKDYMFHLDANINPHILKPLFEEPHQRAFTLFTNHATPNVKGTIRGRWRAHDLIGVEAVVDAPDVQIREERVDRLKSQLVYTNRFLVLTGGELIQSNRVGRADGIGIDFPGRRLFFTNTTGTLPPQSIARAIGPRTAQSMAPYLFEQPPNITMNGVLGMRGHEPTHLRFQIVGEDFSWWKLHVDRIAGQLGWRHNRLTLTNVEAMLYEGEATGSGRFTFFTNRPTDFSFAAALTNAQFQPLIRDVFESTNNLAGRLSGELVVREGRSDSRDTWDGHGRVSLEDGLLWDIPIFAIFSPLFNAISPGLGSSQADEATANFVMINGTIISTDLEIKSTEMNMQYRGSVDHLGNVNALMEARILKEAGPFGPLISTALRPLTKLFEYKLTGTVGKPVAEPIFIPKFLMVALEPFKALGNLLSPPSGENEGAPP